MTRKNKNTHQKNHSKRRRAKRKSLTGIVFRKFSMAHRLISTLLIATILLTSNAFGLPVAVRLIEETKQSAQVWWLFNSGFMEKWLNTPQGTNAGEPNDSPLSRIEIYPANPVISSGTPIHFAAIGYAGEDSIVNAVDYRWEVQAKGDAAARQVSMASSTFVGVVPGEYEISAIARGVVATTRVTVEASKPLDDPVVAELARSGAVISTREQDDTSQSIRQRFSSRGETGKGKGFSGWDGSNYGFADAPGNQPGNPLARTEDEGSGSNNFQFSAPIISSQGRGMFVSLSLTYNSRVWSKAGSTMIFNADRTNPSPGWSIGFGKMLRMGTDGGCMLVEGDGSRHSYSGVYGYEYDTWKFKGYTIDGSFIDYNCGQSSGYALLANGTRIDYTGNLNGDLYPTLITDSNGNKITVTYRSYDGSIETITDTLGRVITFHYDSLNRLIEIKGPSMCDAAGNCAQPYRSLVKLHYKPQQALSYSFAYGLTPSIPNPNFYLIDAIYYPANGTGYWFGASDSYSTYGMITKVSERRGMSWAAGSEEQGTIAAGTMTEERSYNYPLNVSHTPPRTTGIELNDAPAYTVLTEDWDQRDPGTSIPETVFAVDQNSYPRSVSVTYPNGTKKIQYSHNNPGQWNDGMAFREEILSASGVLQSKAEIDWAMDSSNALNYDSPRANWVKTYVEKFNAAGANVGEISRRVEYSYGEKFNQITSTREYDYDGSLIKDTRTEYMNGPEYTKYARTTPYLYIPPHAYFYTYSWQYDPAAVTYLASLAYQPPTSGHHFNLTKSVETFTPSGEKKTRTDYEYDTEPLKPTPDVVQYDHRFNLNTSQTAPIGQCTEMRDPDPGPSGYGWYIACYTRASVNIYQPSSVYRGNITKIKTYGDAAAAGQMITETRRYDMTGNQVVVETACCTQKSFTYNSATQYGFALSQTSGAPVDDPTSDARVTTSSVYDFNTGVVLQKTDENGRITNIQYDPDTLLVTRNTAPTGAYTTFAYDDELMTVTQSEYDDQSQLAAQSIKYFDGNDKMIREKTLSPDGWNAVDARMTNQGEVWKESKPYRFGVETPVWITTTYDPLGRTKKVEEPDGSFIESFYNEDARPSSASTALGETVRSVDAWGRERWGRYNASEKLVEVVEPAANSNGALSAANNVATTYFYNTLDKVIEIQQGGQRRYFAYDSLGRLILQKQAEQTATINNAGDYVGIGGSGAQWAESFKYDSRSNMVEKIDARGVVIRYNYQLNGADDPLNRLQSVEYIRPTTPEAGLTIHEAPKTTFEYVTSGEKRRLNKATSSYTSTGETVTTEDVTYDAEGRVFENTVTFGNRPTRPLLKTYIYDTLNRLKEVIYPKPYGQGSELRKSVTYTYAVGDLLSRLKYDGQDQATEFTYDAANRNKSVKIGTGTTQLTEEYGFDPMTGLMTDQKLKRSTGQEILNLSYEYRRKVNGSYLTGRTGQVTEIVNKLDQGRNRYYSYDGLGRLMQATGGLNQAWSQTYSYDRFGNRTSVAPSGVEGRPSGNAERTATGSVDPGFNPSSFGRLSEVDPRLVTKGSDSGKSVPTIDPTVSTASENTLPKNRGTEPAPAPEQSNVTQAASPFDFDGDGKADLSMWNRSTGNWAVQQSGNGQTVNTLSGAPGDQIAPGDYDGDGKTDIAFWRPSNGQWHITPSSTGAKTITHWGMVGDSIVPADYDGDGKTDKAVWRPSTGVWYIIQSSNGAYTGATWGGGHLGDIPVPGDYDGDAKDDVAIWRPSVGVWYALLSSNGSMHVGNFGSSGDVPVQDDYDNDGKTDWAIWRPSTGYYWIYQSSNGGVIAVNVASSTAADIPVPADYDGDGKADMAMWRASSGTWHVRKSTDASTATYQFGSSGQLAVPSAYRRRSSAPVNQNQEIPRDGHANLSYDQLTNRITSTGFSYDSAGNQKTALAPGGQSSQKFEYDAANRLRVVKSSTDQVLQTYLYGSSNQRLMTTNGPETSASKTYYAWSDSAVVAEYSDGPAGSNTIVWSKSYVFLGDRLLSTVTPEGANDAVKFHHPDQLGTRIISNAADGTFVEQATLPFGTALPSESTGESNRRFTSYDRSLGTTELDYAVNRTYDSQQGRFTQIDPMGSKATTLDDPQTLNLYTYCGNDPINRLDPDGLFWGFLRKLFRWIARIFVAIVRVVIRVIIVIAVLTFIAMIYVLNGLGNIPIIGPILQFIGYVAALGYLLFTGQYVAFGLMLAYIAALAVLSAVATVLMLSIRAEVRESHGLIGFFKALWRGTVKGMRVALLALKAALKLVPPYGYFCGIGYGTDGPTAGETPIDDIDAACRQHDLDMELYKKLYPKGSKALRDAKRHADLRLVRRVFLALRVRGFNSGGYRILLILGFFVRSSLLAMGVNM